jgi:hypothetical protein
MRTPSAVLAVAAIAADLAVSTGVDTGNCFDGNTSATALPKDLDVVLACGLTFPTVGDPTVGRDLAIPVQDALDRLAAAGPRPDYRTMPVPEPQQSSPDPLPSGLRQFRSDSISPIVVAAFIAVVVVVAGAAFLLIRRRRSQSAT